MGHVLTGAAACVALYVGLTIFTPPVGETLAAETVASSPIVVNCKAEALVRPSLLSAWYWLPKQRSDADVVVRIGVNKLRGCAIRDYRSVLLARVGVPMVKSARGPARYVNVLVRPVLLSNTNARQRIVRRVATKSRASCISPALRPAGLPPARAVFEVWFETALPPGGEGAASFTKTYSVPIHWNNGCPR